MALKLRQRNQKKYSVVRQTDLSGARLRWLDDSASRKSPEDIIFPGLVPKF